MKGPDMTDWREQKVVVFESDDWGGLERALPDVETQKALARHPAVVRAMSGRGEKRFFRIMDTLESVEDMDALFKVLLGVKGGDGRPAVFTPVCLLASPDYDAIRANGFTQYVDIGIDQPFPEQYRSRGDIIAKAREGLELGVWVPESHNTRMAAHIDPHKWVKLLRDREDEALNLFFDHNMIGRPADLPPGHWGLEFDSLGREALREWIATGIRYFRNAFGYAPRVVGIADARSRCKVLEEIMEELVVEHGTTVITNAGNHEMGEINAELGLTYTKRNVLFEPLSLPDDEVPHAWKRAYEDVKEAWNRNEPAIVSTHRLHYVSMDPELKAEALAQLTRLLEAICSEHPEAVFRSSHELAGMYGAQAKS